MFAYGDVIPANGAPSQLVTAAIATLHPASLTELARTAGISKFAASRAAAPLIESDLLRVGDDGYHFNDAHPFARDLCRLAWRVSGVQRPEQLAQRSEMIRLPPRHATPSDAMPREYRDVVPAALHARAGDNDDSGPDLITVRDTWLELGEQISALDAYEACGRDVYAKWKTERLRDVVHQTLGFGGAVAEARQTLLEVSTAQMQGDADPRHVYISSHAWARATWLVSAELRDVVGVIAILDRAIWVGGRINTLRSDALYHLEAASYVTASTSAGQHQIAEALASAAEARALWLDDSHGPYANLGGRPRPVDVGTAGDQILAVQLAASAKRLGRLLFDMAHHPALASWRDRNVVPAPEAELFLLDDGRIPLRGSRDWPKTPPKPRGTGPQLDSQSP
ncbi:hypothetical protein SAMN04488570_2866 [Nocardioides scoriae]|uniref:Uncharacterized protein n=1 Tax=Nocardioides scoriae TaxID=642780 RepID=A0A1H1VKL3_9ACTN|nr:hypothetical protein [Nocardioides scoriae]SDS85437.1 hypothetical protein SAMN04488570_2866 [Nocardioides scoriae]